MANYHCPYCFTKYKRGRGKEHPAPCEGDFVVCPRCGQLLAFRWREASEGLELECLMMWGEFQGLPGAVQEQLARIGMAAAQAAQGWQAPRWN